MRLFCGASADAGVFFAGCRVVRANFFGVPALFFAVCVFLAGNFLVSAAAFVDFPKGRAGDLAGFDFGGGANADSISPISMPNTSARLPLVQGGYLFG